MNPSASSTLTAPFFNQQYSSFQALWKPMRMSGLFIVRAPESLSNLDEKTYLELIQTRVDNLIQDWAEATSVAATQKLLAYTLDQLDNTQSTPLVMITADTNTWRQVWSNLLIHDNWRFQERMGHYGVMFPLTQISPSSSDYFDWMEVHNETTLEEWLMTLTA